MGGREVSKSYFASFPPKGTTKYGAARFTLMSMTCKRECRGVAQNAHQQQPTSTLGPHVS